MPMFGTNLSIGDFPSQPVVKAPTISSPGTSLFSAPEQVRNGVRDRYRKDAMIKATEGDGGMFGLMGYGIGRLFGNDPGDNPEANREIRLKDFQQKFAQDNQDINPDNFNDKIKKYASGLLKIGEHDMALKVMKSFQDADEGSATVAKAGNQQKQINTLRTGIEKVTKDMKIIDAARTKIHKNASEGTATGDMGMVFGIMKLYDPNSTVREGEYATAKNAAGIPDRIINLYNNAKDGQLLQPGQRKKFLATAENLYSAQRESTDRSIDQYMQYADEDDISRERVLGKERYKKFTERRSKKKSGKTDVIEVDW